MLGVVAGALAMVRPEGIVFVAVIVLTWVVGNRSWRQIALYTGLLILGMAVLFVPWTVRNAIQMRAPILGTTGLGQVLFQAHHPDATGLPQFNIAIDLWAQHEDIPLPEREVRINNTGIRKALTYAVQHPLDELELVPQRLAAFYRPDSGVLLWIQNESVSGSRVLSSDWASSWGAVADIYYYAVIGCILVGLPFWLRRIKPRHVLVLGPLALYSDMWAFLFVGEARYHFPLLPVFALLAAAGLTAIMQRRWPASEWMSTGGSSIDAGQEP